MKILFTTEFNCTKLSTNYKLLSTKFILSLYLIRNTQYARPNTVFNAQYTILNTRY
jgi:hypothetical protein